MNAANVRVVECGSGPVNAHVCSPFTPRRAPHDRPIPESSPQAGTISTSPDTRSRHDSVLGDHHRSSPRPRKSSRCAAALPAAHPGARPRRRAVLPRFAAAGNDAAWPRLPICLLRHRPVSAADLRAACDRLRLQKEVQVIHRDGLAETAALLQAHAIGAASLVHVDPFDFHAAAPTATSALQLVTRLAAASIPTRLVRTDITTRPARPCACREVRLCRSAATGRRPFIVRHDRVSC